MTTRNETSGPVRVASEAHKTGAECGSRYLTLRSIMAEQCPECAHPPYGTPPCAHEWADHRCRKCHWDGARPAYLKNRDDEV